MALDKVQRINTAVPGSAERALVVQFNQLLTTLRAIAATMDADGGITGTAFAAAVDAGPKQIADESGTVITS